MTTRHEAVRLEFIDDSTAGVLRAAAAYAMLDQAIDSIDGKTVRVAIADLGGETDRLSSSAVRGSSSIDQFSGRLATLAKIAAVVGPSFIPIGAVAIPAVAGLANQLGFAAIAGGTAMIAFQGVGDTLKAVSAAAIEPTTANLEKAHAALEALSPAGRSLVAQLRDMAPLLIELRDSTQSAMFPGLIEGLQIIERLAPSVDAILTTVGETLGEIAADGAASLTSSRWSDFFAMLAIEARPVLMDMASAIGSVVHGLSEMWEAFQPLNRGFGSWLKDAAADFDRWAQGLSQTEGFKEFVDYIHDNGPLVAEAMGSIANAVIQIVEAAAPLGGPVLEAIAGIADAFALIADSPLGTPIMAAVTAMSALSLASTVATASVTRLSGALAGLGATQAGSTVAGVASGGPLGLMFAGIAAGAMNATNQVQRFMDGSQGLGESILRLLPGIREMTMLEDVLGGTERPFLAAAAASGAFAAEIEDVGGRATWVEPKLRILSRALAAQREAAEAGAKSFRDLSTEMSPQKFNLNDWIRDLERQADAMRNLRLNAEAAAEKGLRRGLIAELQRLGPEGALQLRRFASATESQINRANAAWQSQQAEIRRSRDEIRATGEEIDRVGKKRAKPKIDADITGVQQGVASAERLLTGINGFHARTYVTTYYNSVHQGGTGQGGLGPVDDRPIVPRTTPGVTSKMDLVGGTMSSLPLSGRASSPAMGVSETAVTLSALNGQLAEATERYRRANRQLHRMERALERQEKAVDKQREVVEDAARAIQDTLSQMAAFRQDISGRLTQGLFANGSDFDSVIGTLQGNAQGGRSWIESLTTLLGLGLDGPALQALLEQSDAAQLSGVAGWTPEQIQQFEDLFNISTNLTDTAGQLSAQEVFSQQLTEQRQQWAEEKVELAEAKAQRREMIRALEAQEKWVQYLERHKERVERREQENHDNLKKVADRKGPDFGDAGRRRS